MIRFSKNLIRSLFVFFLFVQVASAQTYPVQVNVVTAPPYRNYLASYAEQGAMKVFVTFTDFNSAPIQVRLRMTFSGPGYMFESNVPTTYLLNPGETMILEDDQLTPYLNSTGQAGINAAALPYGNTKVCFEVHRVQNNELLSNPDLCSYFEIGKAMPVQLYRPECNSTVTFSQSNSEIPDPVEFTWTPPFIPIGFTATNTVYIYQWSLNGVSPPQVPLGMVLVDSIPNIPAFQSTVFYTPATSVLIKGQRYAYYIRTRLQSNTNQIENYGWSIPCIFQYGTALSLEEEFARDLHLEWDDETVNGLRATTEREGAAKWKVVQDNGSTANYSSYILSYHKKSETGDDEYEWFDDTVLQLNKAIYQLEPLTTYEAYVRGVLGSYVSEPTEIREFTTGMPRSFQCDVPVGNDVASVYQPLMYADPGMKVRIGAFDLEFVTVQSTGVDGHFAGTGLVPIEFLFGAEAKVRFSDLKIDKSFNVVEGTADVITDGLDNWLTEQYQQFQDPIFVNGTIDSAYVSDSICHLVINGVDTTFTFPCPTCQLVFNDSEGNMVTVYPNGTVVYGSYLEVSNEQLDVSEDRVGVFAQNDDETGGFDAKEHMEWHENYEIIQSSDNANYFVANKSMKVGVADKVDLILPSSYQGETVSLQFSGTTASIAPSATNTQNGSIRLTFNIPAQPEEDELELYAVFDEGKLGKLNVVVYEVKERKVKIIPIASTSVTATGLEQYLDQIYASAGFDFEVEKEDAFSTDSINSETNVFVEESTTLQKYSQQMKSIRNGYFSTREEESETFYLFVVHGLTDGTTNNIKGFVPRGKAVGFIEYNSDLDVFAHELGHGGGLQHSWLNNGPGTGQTINLMDYPESGTTDRNLIKSQWEELRDPSFLPGFWDESEDSEVAGGSVQFYDVLVEMVNGQERIVSRTYCTNQPYIKNGDKNALPQPVGYVTGVNKYWKVINGKQEVIRYVHFGKVFYLNEVVDCDNKHVRFSDHDNSNTIKYYPGDPGKTAPGVYEVRRLYLSGTTDPYKYVVRNYKLLPVINHYEEYDGQYKLNIFINDKKVSDDFRALHAKYKSKQATYEDIVLFFHTHPKVIQENACFPVASRNAEAAHFKGGTNDPVTGRYHPPAATNWYVQYMPAFYVGRSALGSSGYEGGLSVKAIIKTGDVYTRETINIEPSASSAATSYSIHKDRGADNCHHTLTLVNEQIEWLKHMLDRPSEYDIDDVAEYIAVKGYCMLHDIELSYRKKLFDRLVYRDDAWSANRVNILSCTYFTATKPEDEKAMLHFMKGETFGRLRAIYDNLEEYFDLNEGKDLNLAMGLFKHVSYDLAKYPNEFAADATTTIYSNPLSYGDKSRNAEIAFVNLPIFIGNRTSGMVINIGQLDDFKMSNYTSKLVAEFTGSNTPMEWQTDGTVKVIQNYTIYEELKKGGNTVRYEVIKVNQVYYLNPYDFVDIIVASNYAAAGMDAGDIMTVPVFSGMVLQQMLENAKFADDNRVLMRVAEVVIAVAAVVATPFTAGSSLALAVEGIAILNAITDISFACWEQGLTTSQYEANSEFMAAQQSWANAIDIITGITGASIASSSSAAIAAKRIASLQQFSIKVGGKVVSKGKSWMKCILTARWLRFGKKVGGTGENLLSMFKQATGINAVKVTDNSLLANVKSWQGVGNYPGIDDWEIFEIPAGTKLYGGLPGQSEFYSIEKSLLDANYEKAAYWESLQVSPHPQFGYRTKVGEYTVNTTIRVAVSRTLANPQHGVGGAWQVFVDNFANNVTLTKEVNLN